MTMWCRRFTRVGIAAPRIQTTQPGLLKSAFSLTTNKKGLRTIRKPSMQVEFLVGDAGFEPATPAV